VSADPSGMVRERDAARIDELISSLARHGALSGGGLCRLAYDPAWQAAVAELEERMAGAGFEVRHDAVGNRFGRLDPAAGGSGEVLATGSHIDSALVGGNFDGPAGIVASFVALLALHEAHGAPRRPVELVVICDEEASRFPSNLWGSRAIAGRIEPDETGRLRDRESVTIGEAMRSCGLDPDDIPAARRADINTWLELHIEQGPRLEQAGVPIGVVSAITGMRQAEHVVEGASNHAGSTPLEGRRDPVQGLAEMAQAVDRRVRSLGEPARGTVGRVASEPGAPNIISARATLTTDLRHPDADRLGELIAGVDGDLEDIARRRGLGLRSRTLLSQPATPMDAELVALEREAADALGIASLELHSGGGHDTQMFAQAGARCAMVFVQSRDGISHAPEEHTDTEHLLAGTRVLAEMLLRLAW
jgi:allantoate deiminase